MKTSNATRLVLVLGLIAGLCGVDWASGNGGLCSDTSKKWVDEQYKRWRKGSGIKPTRKIDRPVPITCSAATGLEHLGLQPSKDAAKSVLDLATA